MQMNARVCLQELFDARSFVSREIVQNDVDLPLRRLLGNQIGEEGNKFFTGVSRGGLPENLPACRIQCGIKRQRSMSIVLKSVALGASRRERKHGVEAIERL